jgi:hypothetical protein
MFCVVCYVLDMTMARNEFFDKQQMTAPTQQAPN